MLHAAEIDDAVPPGAKEGGGIQPGFAFPQRAPDQGGRIAQIHACIIATGLESRNFRGSDDPAFHVVAKEYEIVASEYFSFLARDIVLESGVVNDPGQLRGRLPMAGRGKVLKIARSPLAERAFAKLIEDHGSVVAEELCGKLIKGKTPTALSGELLNSGAVVRELLVPCLSVLMRMPGRRALHLLDDADDGWKIEMVNCLGEAL